MKLVLILIFVLSSALSSFGQLYGPRSSWTTAYVGLTPTNGLGIARVSFGPTNSFASHENYSSGSASGFAEAVTSFSLINASIGISFHNTDGLSGISRSELSFEDTYLLLGPTGNVVVTPLYQLQYGNASSITTVEGETLGEFYSTNELQFSINGVETNQSYIECGVPFKAGIRTVLTIGFSGPYRLHAESHSFSYDYQLKGFSISDEFGTPISNNYTIVSESGELFPRTPPIHSLRGQSQSEYHEVYWHSYTNHSYFLEESDSLSSTSWNALTPLTQGNGQTNYAEVSHTNQLKFLRLITKP